MNSVLAAAGFCLLATGVICGQATSPLFSRGFTVIPQPRQVKLEPDDFRFGSGWRLEIGPGVAKNSVAVRTLTEDLESRFGMVFKEGGSGPAVRLEIAPGSVQPGPAQDRDDRGDRGPGVPDGTFARAYSDHGQRGCRPVLRRRNAGATDET